MNTRERILTLQDNGTELHVIAAMLGLAVTDVSQTLTNPAFVPPDPSGGGGLTPGATVAPVMLGLTPGEPRQLDGVNVNVLLSAQVTLQLDPSKQSQVFAELKIAATAEGLADAVSQDVLLAACPVFAGAVESPNGPPIVEGALVAILPPQWWFEVAFGVGSGNGGVLFGGVKYQPLA